MIKTLHQENFPTNVSFLLYCLCIPCHHLILLVKSIFFIEKLFAFFVCDLIRCVCLVISMLYFAIGVSLINFNEIVLCHSHILRHVLYSLTSHTPFPSWREVTTQELKAIRCCIELLIDLT